MMTKNCVALRITGNDILYFHLKNSVFEKFWYPDRDTVVSRSGYRFLVPLTVFLLPPSHFSPLLCPFSPVSLSSLLILFITVFSLISLSHVILPSHPLSVHFLLSPSPPFSTVSLSS